MDTVDKIKPTDSRCSRSAMIPSCSPRAQTPQTPHPFGGGAAVGIMGAVEFAARWGGRSVFLTALLVSLAWSGVPHARAQTAPKDTSEKTAEETGDVYQMLAIFGEVLNRIRLSFVREVDEAHLVEVAVRAMLNELDNYSDYLDARSFRTLQDSIQGEFGGIGARISTADDGRIMVHSVLPGRPAEQAGLRGNDIIVAIDGVPTDGIDVQKAVSRIRGKVNTVVRLTIRRDGEESVRSVVRGTVRSIQPPDPVVIKNVVYVRLPNFTEQATEDITRALAQARQLLEAHELSLGGMILDLRNNPGGLLDQAVKVSDLFLEGGEIVTVKNQRGDGNGCTTRRFNALPGDVLDNMPMVILVNKQSASASEIVAGALRDHRRAVLVGESTFGKGAVQNLFDIGSLVGTAHNESGIRLTTQFYFTPVGDVIEGRGITPRYKVKMGDVEDESVHPDADASADGGEESLARTDRSDEEVPFPDGIVVEDILGLQDVDVGAGIVNDQTRRLLSDPQFLFAYRHLRRQQTP